MSNVTSTGPSPLATSPLNPLAETSPAIGKRNGRMVRQNSSPTTGVMDSQLQLAQTINRNTFGFASRVVQVNLNNPTAQAATSHPRPSTISPSSSSSATSVGGQPKSQSNSNTSQTGNPTAPQNKTEAQQTQRIDTAEKFLVAAKKLNEMRTQYEGQSGIGKYLPGSKSKTAMRAARQALGQQIQNHPFSQDPQINKQMVGLWLATASGLSPKDQKVIYNQIQQKLLGSEYRSEILQMLNEQAKNNPLIEGIRDAYNIKAESDRILGGFRSNLTAALNGSTEDKIAFIKQFEGNLNLNNQPLQIIQEEQAAIKALLAKDNLTPSNRVFLQQMDLAYEMKLNENNPKKMLELASRFMELERPLLQQVAQSISQTKELSEAQKQEISNAKGMTVIAARIFDAICPNPSTKVLANKFETREDAFLAIYSMCTPQTGMRFASLIGEMEKQALKSDLKTAKLVAQELQGYMSQFSSNTALFTARADAFSTEELKRMTAGDLMTPKPTDERFIKLDQKYFLRSLTASPSENLRSLQTITEQLSSKTQSNSQKAQLQKQLAAIIKYTSIPNTSPENQQIFLAALKGIAQCSPNDRPALLHALHDQLKKSVDQANPASEVNKLLLQQVNLGIEAMDFKNDPPKLLDAEKQFLSNGIRYLTNQLNPPIDSQQTKQLLATADIFSQMVNTMFPTPVLPRQCTSKNDALKTVQLNFFQHIPRLFLLVREIDSGIERPNQAHLQHALQEYHSVTEHMMPMLELAQERVGRMPLEVLNRVGQEIISPAAIDTYDERYGITPEMRQRAGGEN